MCSLTCCHTSHLWVIFLSMEMAKAHIQYTPAVPLSKWRVVHSSPQCTSMMGPPACVWSHSLWSEVRVSQTIKCLSLWGDLSWQPCSLVKRALDRKSYSAESGQCPLCCCSPGAASLLGHSQLTSGVEFGTVRSMFTLWYFILIFSSSQWSFYNYLNSEVCVADVWNRGKIKGLGICIFCVVSEVCG